MGRRNEIDYRGEGKAQILGGLPDQGDGLGILFQSRFHQQVYANVCRIAIGQLSYAFELPFANALQNLVSDGENGYLGIQTASLPAFT